MLSVDTNVLVRFLVADHPEQTAYAGDLIHNNQIWIAKSILLETEWVLRDAYGYSPAEVARAFRRVSGLPQVQVETSFQVARALDWLESGMDFADALHLASSEQARQFATFDRRFAAKATKITGARILLLR